MRHILKLSGAESLTECNRELCGAQDCCGDKAYVVTVQSVGGSGHSKRKRRRDPPTPTDTGALAQRAPRGSVDPL